MEIPDIQYVFIILCSLNEDFDGIASQISAVPPAQLTVEGVTARLMGELDRREACAISTPISRKNEERHMQTCGDTTAFKAAKRCWFCNKQGHFAKDCRSKESKALPSLFLFVSHGRQLSSRHRTVKTETSRELFTLAQEIVKELKVPSGILLL
ncbi:fatty acid synthase-like [Podarcis lilfordi]|uniref:Fatty acid synthase-like n=1 Tax=Podarcis lilfordi TaxID=74358 RepID=A0AA35L621_9SAUR|nr:fatty acid synthase-like [Podarcis lilfordi]